MRIEALRALFAVVWLTALLWPQLTAANNVTLPIASRKTREVSTRGHNTHWLSKHDVYKHKSLDVTYREIQRDILKREGGEESRAVNCCRIVEEMTKPEGGRNAAGMYVELYADYPQVFYEYSCHDDDLDRPCRFVDRKLANQSRCVQMYSYSYAIVKTSNKHPKDGEESEHKIRHNHLPSLGSNSTWALDHIRVRSGCGCEVSPKPKKKHDMSVKPKKVKSKMKKAREEEFD